jgi:hypothetical protein
MKRTFIVVALIAALIAPVWAQNTGTTPDGFEWEREGLIGLNGLAITSYTGTATTVRIPERINNLPVVAIYGEAFKGNTRITSVTIPNTVIIIGYEVFRGCVNLTSVTLSSSLTDIDGNAFNGCVKLTSITLPASIGTIAGGAFRGCSALTTINIPDSVTSITFGINMGTMNSLNSATRSNTTQFQGTRLNDASRQRLVNRGYTGQF